MAPTTITIDVEQFTRSRDAVVTALLTLSNSLEKAAKEYAVHTNTVLTGDASLSHSELAKIFSSAAALGGSAQVAVAQLADAAAEGEDEAEIKKRVYKTRDPNAPKRPLTAYFRYLGDNRQAIQAELAKTGSTTPGELAELASTRWKAMSEIEKQPYHHAYQLAKVEYDKKVEEYNKTKPDDGTTSKPKKVKASKAAPEEKPAVTAAPAEADSDETSSEEEAAPPPPPSTKKGKKASSPEAVKKTPKAAAAAAPSSTPAVEKTPKATEKTPKTSKKKAAGAAAPTPVFNSINTAPPAPATGKKRKSEAAVAAPETPAATTDSPAKKRKVGRPTMTAEEKEKAAEKRKAAKESAA